MQLRLTLVGSFSAIIAVFVACSSSPDSPGSSTTSGCVPNATQSCTCAGGLPGAQVCEAGGNAFSPCDCGVPEAGGASTEAGDDQHDSATTLVDAGSGQVAVLGTSCAVAGALACAGNFQKVTLLCGTDKTWQVNTTCAADQYCDSTPGPNAGVCRPALPQCQRSKPGDTYCIPPASLYAAAYLYACGPDTVTSTPVKDCRQGVTFANPNPPGCAEGVCTICTPGDYRCNGKQRQDCSFVGGAYTWRDILAPCTRNCAIGGGAPICD